MSSVALCISARHLIPLCTIPVSSPINSMPIFLLKFPILVIAEIIKSLDHKRIFILSLASTRTRNVIKASIPSTRCSIRLKINGTDLTCNLENADINAVQDPQNEDAATYKIGFSSYKVVIRPYDNRFYIYWTQRSEKMDCFKNVMTHISETFNKPTVGWFSMTGMGTGEPDLDIIRHSKPLFPSIEQMRYSNSNITPKVFIQTFEEFRNFKCLFLDVRLPDDFEYSPSSPDHFQIDKVYFRNEFCWMKLDDYMQCKAISLLGRSTEYYTPTILNAFIKKWIDADCRLETLEVFSDENIDFPTAANGLGMIQHNGNQQFVEFEGANGKKARISKRNETFKMEVRK